MSEAETIDEQFVRETEEEFDRKVDAALERVISKKQDSQKERDAKKTALQFRLDKASKDLAEVRYNFLRHEAKLVKEIDAILAEADENK